MENQIQVFNSEEFGTLHAVNFDVENYFVGKDVTDMLGYVNSRKAIDDHVDDEDKLVITRKQAEEMASSQDSNQALLSLFGAEFGGTQRITLINESGVHSLILNSKLPNAKRCKHWITSKVMPSIRKHGVYATDDFIQKTIANPKWAIDVLTAYQEEKDKNVVLVQENAVLNQQIAELMPKASYYDVVLNSPDLLTVSEFSKDYGMSATEFNKLLHKLSIQFKQGDIWLLYQKYAKNGWTQTAQVTYTDKKGFLHSKPQTRWTQKGRLELYYILKEYGILPTIEAGHIN